MQYPEVQLSHWRSLLLKGSSFNSPSLVRLSGVLCCLSCFLSCDCKILARSVVCIFIFSVCVLSPEIHRGIMFFLLSIFLTVTCSEVLRVWVARRISLSELAVSPSSGHLGLWLTLQISLLVLTFQPVLFRCIWYSCLKVQWIKSTYVNLHC